MLLPVLITETVPSPKFVTYAKAPFGVMATARGVFPTDTLATTMLLLVLITETLPGTGPEFVT
jgi:hypothetical protein